MAAARTASRGLPAARGRAARQEPGRPAHRRRHPASRVHAPHGGPHPGLTPRPPGTGYPPAGAATPPRYDARVSAKPVPLYYGDRKVFTVAGFNQGVSWYLRKLPAVWVEGEIAELKRSDSWGFV